MRKLARPAGANNLRPIRHLKNIPVILCTGYSENVDETLAKSNGILEFIMKPLTIYSLSEVVNKYLTPSTAEGTSE